MFRRNYNYDRGSLRKPMVGHECELGLACETADNVKPIGKQDVWKCLDPLETFPKACEHFVYLNEGFVRRLHREGCSRMKDPNIKERHIVEVIFEDINSRERCSIRRKLSI